MTQTGTLIHKLIMKKIKIAQFDDVYFKYAIDEPDFVRFLYTRQSCRINIDEFRNSGFLSSAKINRTYNGVKFIIHEAQIAEGYDISIRMKNNPTSCLHISTDTKIGIAYAQHIQYAQHIDIAHSKDRVSVGFRYFGDGRSLLIFCIKFLKENLTKYGIRRIQLIDNSMFAFSANKQYVELSVLHTLMFGDTFYGKYRFRPYDSNNDVEDDILMKMYNKNKMIVTTTKAKDTNIFKYFLETLDECHPDKKKENKELIKEYYKKYNNLSLTHIFKKFMTDFQETYVGNPLCDYGIRRFCLDFYTNQKLHRFYAQSFYLDI